MKMPTWLNEVNPMSGLTFRDVMAMFGYRSQGALWAAIKRGDFPPADSATAGPRHQQRVWLVKTIKREIHRRNQMSSNAPHEGAAAALSRTVPTSAGLAGTGEGKTC